MFGSTLNSIAALALVLFPVVVPSSTPQMESVSHVESVVSFELPDKAFLTVTASGGAEL
ncbi:MAG: hypothetical protein H9W81_18505 [Enterococcus sp.]|nr:hypothetical protein [Enterococcus sp.]